MVQEAVEELTLTLVTEGIMQRMTGLVMDLQMGAMGVMD